jgi:hypothetical protein
MLVVIQDTIGLLIVIGAVLEEGVIIQHSIITIIRPLIFDPLVQVGPPFLRIQVLATTLQPSEILHQVPILEALGIHLPQALVERVGLVVQKAVEVVVLDHPLLVVDLEVHLHHIEAVRVVALGVERIK